MLTGQRNGTIAACARAGYAVVLLVAAISLTASLVTGCSNANRNDSASAGDGSGAGTGSGPALTFISVTGPGGPVLAGAVVQLTATGRYDDGSSRDLTAQTTWISSNNGIATMNANGVMLAGTSGSVSVRATFGGVQSPAMLITVHAGPGNAGGNVNPGYELNVRSDLAPVPEELAGRTVVGNIYVTVEPPVGLRNVTFYLDDPDMAKTPFQIEGNPPYDFNGGTSAMPNPWDSSLAPDGAHTITARLEPTSGGMLVLDAEFIVLNNVPRLSFDDTAIAFAFAESETGTDTSSVNLALTNGSDAAFALEWENTPWLTISASSQTLPAVVSVSVNAQTLTVGSHEVVLNASTAGYAGAQVTITVVVSAAPTADDPPPGGQGGPAALAFSKQSIRHSYTVAEPGTGHATVTLSAANASAGTFTLEHEDPTWLEVTTDSSTLPALIGVTVHSQDLAAGVYETTIHAHAAGLESAALSVRVNVSTTTAGVASSINRHGITWTFDGDYEVGQFANGDWYVVGPVTIQSVSPAWTGSRNGSMVNPRYGGDHGYDSRWDFKASLRVSTNDLVLEPGDSLVSTVGWVLGEAGCPSTNNTLGIPRPTIKSAAVLTVVAQAPPAGSFRPPYGGNDKPLYNVDDLHPELLPRLGRVDSTPTMASIEKLFERLWLDHTEKWKNRYTHPSENMKDYCRDLASQFNTGSLMLMLDFTDAEKRTLMIRLVQIGIDMHAILKTGATYGDGGGGIGSGRKWPILLAGLLLDDQEMMGIGFDYDDIHSLEDCQTFYLTAADASKYPGKPLGHPVWGERHCYAPSYYSDPGNIAYRTCCTANAWVGAVLSAHIMGAKDLWNHDPLFDYQDWYMGDEDRGDWKRSWSDFQEEMWDTYRADYGDVWGE